MSNVGHWTVWALMAMAMAVGLPVQAGEEGFYRAHLLPKLNRQLQAIPEIRALPSEAEALAEFALYDQVTELSRHRAERGARKALKSYLLETTSLRHVVRALRGERRQADARHGALDYGLSIAHGAARLELRRGLRSGGLRVGIDTHGGVDLVLNHSRLTRMRLVMAYDRRERSYDFGCRLHF